MSENSRLENEKNSLWQWLVIAALSFSLLISLYIKLSPPPKPKLPLGYEPLTIEQQIEAYRKQLGPDKKNYVVLNMLAGAYIRQAKATGDPAWYILADQSANASLNLLSVRNYGALIALANVESARHEFSSAIKYASQVTEDPKNYLNAYSIIFDSHYAMGDLKQAAKDLDEIKKVRKYYQQLHEKGMVLNEEPEVENGIGQIREAMLLQATGHEKQSVDRFISGILKLGNTEPEIKAWAYTVFAGARLQQGNLPEAKSDLRFALNNQPGYINALIFQAEAARREQHWQDIINALEPINKIAPRSELMIRLAESYKKLGQSDKAQKILQEAEKLLGQEAASGGFGHQRDYIRVLLLENHPDSVRAASRKADNELKRRHDLDTLLVAAEAKLKNREPEKAGKILETALSTGVHDARIYYWQGRLAGMKGNHPSEKDFFRKALAQNPAFDPDYAEEIKSFLR